eukprot:Skav227009  [mRNA]  locus=scaffold456:1677:8126:+ [translate_table: standard]
MKPGAKNGSDRKGLNPRQTQDAILTHHTEIDTQQKLRLHKAWKLDEEPKLRSSTSHSTVSTSFLKMGSSQFSNPGEIPVRKSGSNRTKEETFRWYDRLTVSHRSPICMVWDIWTSIAIAYDMVMTPMDAFNIEITPAAWTKSFVRSFGKLNGTEDTIRMRYMSFLRAIRLFRLLRVLRVAKVKAGTNCCACPTAAHLADPAKTSVMSIQLRITDRGFLMLNIAKSLLVVTVINHFTACVWYAIATIVEADENNWVYNHFSDPSRPDSLLYLYTTAYHWSITQLTPASCEIYPSSARERIFNIAVILFGSLDFEKAESEFSLLGADAMPS